MGSLSLIAVPAEDQLFIDKVIRRRLGRPGALLGILEEVQAHHPHKYLPLDVLRYVATKTEITFSKIYSVAEPIKIHYLWRPQLRDPSDEMVLETAVNGRANLLITFNVRDYGTAPARFGIEVKTPREAVERISK